MKAPVITVDGPSGVGKGTLCQLLARRLGWHLLDSGALYRVVGWFCEQRQLDTGVADNAPQVAGLARQLPVRFAESDNGTVAIMVEGQDISDALRSEQAGEQASRVAAMAPVRDALLERQRAFRELPGLVADGRDMGTVVFQDAPLKLFLTATAAERARRRYQQLLDKGESVSLPRLLEAIEERDLRDRTRPVAPLKPAGDAVIIDTTSKTVDEVFADVSALAVARGLVKGPQGSSR